VPATVRPRTAADLPGCVTALHDVHRADGYPANWPADPAGWLTPRGLLTAWAADAGSDGTGGTGGSDGAGGIGDTGGIGGIGGTGGTGGSAGADGIGGHVALVAEADAITGGTVAVARLFVSPAARGGGLGRALLTAARDEAVRRGERAWLEVESGATAAIALYRAAGWLPMGCATARWRTAGGELAQVCRFAAPGG
jgi:GNAT superfamily N-acetyltransferase